MTRRTRDPDASSKGSDRGSGTDRRKGVDDEPTKQADLGVLKKAPREEPIDPQPVNPDKTSTGG